MKFSWAIVLFTFPAVALAEYRVYQYMVKSRDTAYSVNNAPARAVISTLNPVAYRAYHGGSSIDLTLMRTWMCVGYTGKGKEPCTAPGDKAVTL